MKAVYIAAPLSAPTREDIEENRARASRWVAWAAARGVAPVADWIILTGQVEETPENRARGLAIDCALVERCEEVWLVGGRVTPGMEVERVHAQGRGIPVYDLTPLGPEPPTIPVRSVAGLAAALGEET